MMLGKRISKSGNAPDDINRLREALPMRKQ